MTVIPGRRHRHSLPLRIFVAFAEWLGDGSNLAVLGKVWMVFILLPTLTFFALNAYGLVS